MIAGSDLPKRAFDITCAAAILLFSWPIILLLVLAIRMGSKGPGIFVQKRVGRGERLFPCYKLRSMYAHAPHVPSHLVSSFQITTLGRFLRKWKLDELPQLWNVLRGDMSLVGPRPSLPTQVDLIERRRKLGVLNFRPGMTGLAQIDGIDMSDPDLLARKDAEYIQTHTFAGDIEILVRTIWRGSRASGA